MKSIAAGPLSRWALKRLQSAPRRADFRGLICLRFSLTKGFVSPKGGLSKGAFCAKQTFLQGNGLPSAVGTGKWIAQCGGHSPPPPPWKVSPEPTRASALANPICKCRRHKAGHLQVRVAVGRQSTCVLKEAPFKKGPLGSSPLALRFPPQNSFVW